MKEYFYDYKMWCKSKHPQMQKAFKLLAKEEMKLVDQHQRERLYSHSLVERALHTDENLKHLFNVIRTMQKKRKDPKHRTKRREFNDMSNQ